MTVCGNYISQDNIIRIRTIIFITLTQEDTNTATRADTHTATRADKGSIMFYILFSRGKPEHTCITK